MSRRAGFGTALLALTVVAACDGGPPAIAWGSDNCDFCRMTITDRRFGAAAITAGGRTVRFDAVECLVGWAAAQPAPPREFWVSDASHPGTLIPAGDADFYRLPDGRSPMGRGLIAAARGADPALLGLPSTAPSLSWEEVRRAVPVDSAPAVVAPGAR